MPCVVDECSGGTVLRKPGGLTAAVLGVRRKKSTSPDRFTIKFYVPIRKPRFGRDARARLGQFSRDDGVSHPPAPSRLAASHSSGRLSTREGRPTGVLVVGHGTADPVGAEETRQLSRHVAALLSTNPVELGFLEVIGPSIGDAIGALAGQGCERVIVAPLLLFTAGHARRDVPEAVIEAARRHRIDVTQASALGCHPQILALSRHRRQEALAALSPTAAVDTVAVFLGRGSSVPDGVAQFREWVVASLTGDGLVHPEFGIGFAAAARPTLDEALEAAADRRPRRIVVQPHLLFRGHVEHQVTDAVVRWRAARPEIEWVQVARLGADRRVAEALVSRVAEAAATAHPDEGWFSREKNLSPEAG